MLPPNLFGGVDLASDERERPADKEPTRQQRDLERLYQRPVTARDRREGLRRIGKRYGRWQ